MSPSIVRAAESLSGFHDVRDYGAKGDGRTVDSDAINKAIMAASRAGGGTVIIPPGRYLSFSIRLQSHITLLIAQGAVLEAADPTKHRSEEHTSELQSLMRISYAVFCLKKKQQRKHTIKSKYHNKK